MHGQCGWFWPVALVERVKSDFGSVRRPSKNFQSIFSLALKSWGTQCTNRDFIIKGLIYKSAVASGCAGWLKRVEGASEFWSGHRQTARVPRGFWNYKMSQKMSTASKYWDFHVEFYRILGMRARLLAKFGGKRASSRAKTRSKTCSIIKRKASNDNGVCNIHCTHYIFSRKNRLDKVYEDRGGWEWSRRRIINGAFWARTIIQSCMRDATDSDSWRCSRLTTQE